MQVKDGICKLCGKAGKVKSKICALCAAKRFRSYGQPKKDKKQKNKPIEQNGELALFNAIWNTRPRVSFLSGTPLTEFNVWCFSHVLRKAPGAYPKFKLYDKNIILLTPQEHVDFDNKAPSDLLRKDPRWEKVFTLKALLKEQYENQEKTNQAKAD